MKLLSKAQVLAIIAEVYATLPSGGEADAADRRYVEERAGEATATYGEISPEAAADLLGWMQPGPKDVLVDVGSGTGRLTIQALLTSELSRAVAIELSPFRHRVAEQARDELGRRHPDFKARLDADLSLIEGDFRGQFPADASLVWAGSICFPDSLMSALGRELAAAPGLRRFVSLKALPAASSAASRLVELAAVDLDMSWTRNVRALVYGPVRS